MVAQSGGLGTNVFSRWRPLCWDSSAYFLRRRHPPRNDATASPTAFTRRGAQSWRRRSTGQSFCGVLPDARSVGADLCVCPGGEFLLPHRAQRRRGRHSSFGRAAKDRQPGNDAAAERGARFFFCRRRIRPRNTGMACACLRPIPGSTHARDLPASKPFRDLRTGLESRRRSIRTSIRSFPMKRRWAATLTKKMKWIGCKTMFRS